MTSILLLPASRQSFCVTDWVTPGAGMMWQMAARKFPVPSTTAIYFNLRKSDSNKGSLWPSG